MLRMRKTIYYFTKYHGRSGDLASQYSKEVSWGYFLGYLKDQKNFCEDWRDTLKRFYHYLFKRWIKQGTIKGRERQRKQRQVINDLIQKCIDEKYIEITRNAYKKTYLELYLAVNYKGRDLVKGYPLPSLNFIEAWLKKYNRITVVVFSVIGTGIIGTFFAKWYVIFNNFTDWLSKTLFS